MSPILLIEIQILTYVTAHDSITKDEKIPNSL